MILIYLNSDLHCLNASTGTMQMNCLKTSLSLASITKKYWIIYPAFGKMCNCCGRKNHFKSKCTQTQQRSSRYSEGSKSKRSDRARGKCMYKCNVHEICRDNCQEDDNSIEDLTDQVQSLFHT